MKATNSNKTAVALVLIALVLVGTGILGSGLFSTLAITQTTIGTNPDGQPAWLILMKSSSFAEDVKVFNAGDSVGGSSDNVLKERVQVSLDYDQGIATYKYDTANAFPASCMDGLARKSIDIYAYPYTTPENPKFSQTAKVKAIVGTSTVFDEVVDLTDSSKEISENGVYLIPEFLFYKENPTIIAKGTSVIYDTRTSESYVLSTDKAKAIFDKYKLKYTLTPCGGAVCIMINQGITFDFCPWGGPNEAYTNVMNEVRLAGATPPAQYTASSYDYATRTFSSSTGILTMKSSNAQGSVFTLQIPAKIGDMVVWGPKLLTPTVTKITPAETKVDSSTKFTYEVCNGAAFGGNADIVISNPNGGISFSSPTMTLALPASGCATGEFYAQKQTDDATDRQIKVTASSRTNVNSKTISIGTTAREVAPVPPSVQNTSVTPTPVVTPSTCIPLLQKQSTTTSGGMNILNLFTIGGTQVATCTTDYGALSLIVLALGIFMFFYGDSKNKPDFKVIGVNMVLIGAGVWLGLQFFESTFLSYFGGNGIILLAALGLLIYYTLGTKITSLLNLI